MREGQPCHVDTAPVQRGPALTAAAHRHPLTPEPLPAPGVRFVTYNNIGRPVHIAGVFTESALWLLPKQVLTLYHTVQPWLPKQAQQAH